MMDASCYLDPLYWVGKASEYTDDADIREFLAAALSCLVPMLEKEFTGGCPEGRNCPTGWFRCHSLYSCITHLNDEHAWTYNQIADWLEAQDVDLTIRTIKEVRDGS